MYQQTYNPAINTPARPAMCLQYIDDAGNAPSRSPTAKAAYLYEMNSGRIQKGELPEGIWVIVWFEFTKGSYTYPKGQTIYYKDAWHVAFARRKGNIVELHDSEVHSGSRGVYNSIAELERWFAVYGTKFAGWSTNCDNRQYAKKGRVMSEEDAKEVYRLGLHREPENDDVWRALVGSTFEEISKKFRSSEEWLTQNHILLVQNPERGGKIVELEEKISNLPKEVVIEKPVEVIREVVKEVPVEKIVEKEVIKEVIKSDDDRTFGDLLGAAFKKLLGQK